MVKEGSVEKFIEDVLVIFKKMATIIILPIHLVDFFKFYLRISQKSLHIARVYYLLNKFKYAAKRTFE